MKKTFFILVLSLSYLSCLSQINYDLWGMKIGKTTKNEVLRIIQKDSELSRGEISDILHQDDLILLFFSQCSFKHLNHQWSSMSLEFYNDILYKVQISCNIYNDTMHALSIFDDVINQIDSKYHKYNVTKNPQGYLHQFIDESNLSLTILTSSSDRISDSISIFYTDLVLLNKKYPDD